MRFFTCRVCRDREGLKLESFACKLLKSSFKAVCRKCHTPKRFISRHLDFSLFMKMFTFHPKGLFSSDDEELKQFNFSLTSFVWKSLFKSNDFTQQIPNSRMMLGICFYSYCSICLYIHWTFLHFVTLQSQRSKYWGFIW